MIEPRPFRRGLLLFPRLPRSPSALAVLSRVALLGLIVERLVNDRLLGDQAFASLVFSEPTRISNLEPSWSGLGPSPSYR
jgi:hypothetical protein